MMQRVVCTDAGDISVIKHDVHQRLVYISAEL